MPRSRVPGPARARSQAIGRTHGVRIATFGHAGDGNLHPNFIFDHDDPRAEELTDLVRADLCRAAIGLGGTVTAEHGIGIARRDGARRAGRRRRRRRHAVDQDGPRSGGILNPGRVF